MSQIETSSQIVHRPAGVYTHYTSIAAGAASLGSLRFVLAVLAREARSQKKQRPPKKQGRPQSSIAEKARSPKNKPQVAASGLASLALNPDCSCLAGLLDGLDGLRKDFCETVQTGSGVSHPNSNSCCCQSDDIFAKLGSRPAEICSPPTVQTVQMESISMAKRSRKKLTGRKGKLVPLSEAVTTQHVDSPSGNVKRAETLQQARRALLEANPIRAQELLLDHNPEDFDNLVDDISETAPSGEVAAMAEGLEEAGETKAVERVRKHLASREARFGVDTEAHVHARASRDLIRRDLALAEEARKLQPSIEVLGVTSGSPGLATMDYAGKQGDFIDSLHVK